MKRTPLRKVSKKMSRQRYQERKLTEQLSILSEGRCEICGGNDFRGLHKHEIIKRSHQGDETDPKNCLLLCLSCHDHRKYPVSGTVLTLDEQLDLARKLHSVL